MKTFTTILKIIAIGAVIAIGMSACGTSGAPKEMDEQTLALKETLDSASWEVKAMSKNRPITNDFKDAEKMELAAFQNISVTQNMELGRWYALSAPEMPGIYYYYSKYNTGSMLIGTKHYLYKSTTIDAETFASRTDFFSAAWQSKAISGQPSTGGLEKLDGWGSIEAMYFENLLPEDGYDKWFSFTAPEMPDVIYYYFEKTPQLVTVGETRTVYKGIQ